MKKHVLVLAVVVLPKYAGSGSKLDYNFEEIFLRRCLKGKMDGGKKVPWP